MTTTMEECSVLIVAEDPLARTGLATLLSDWPQCDIVGQLPVSPDLVPALDIYRPDIVVWDLGWDPEAALEFFEELGNGGPPIVVLMPDETRASDLWNAGAQALLPRDVSADGLVLALQAVVGGLVVIDPTLGEALKPSPELTPEPLVEDLTPRELEVLQLLAQGLSNRAIGYQLEISEHTVKFHVNSIMGKLGAQSRTDAAVRATRLGLILL